MAVYGGICGSCGIRASVGGCQFVCGAAGRGGCDCEDGSWSPGGGGGAQVGTVACSCDGRVLGEEAPPTAGPIADPDEELLAAVGSRCEETPPTAGIAAIVGVGPVGVPLGQWPPQ